MLDINKLKNRKALIKVEEYSGKNEYILSLKEKLEKDGSLFISPSVAEYIELNFDRDPIEINKIIPINDFFGKHLKEKFDLNHVPEKILVEWVLGETEKSYHVKGKTFKNQKYSPIFYIPKTQIAENLLDVEVDVEIDFDKYQKMDKRGWRVFPHQETGVKFLLTKNNRILGDDMGLGKVIANDRPVLTPNGWVEHGSLVVGDYVIGSNGKPTKVLAVYPNPLKDYYNITFTDGTVVEACDEHLWSVYTPSQKKCGTKNQILTIKDMLDSEKVVVSNGIGYNEKKKYTTKTYYKMGNGDCKWYIPMVKPVEFNSRGIKIDPYLLGVLLGDGSISTMNRVGLTSKDPEIINEISSRLPNNMLISDLKEEISFGFIMKDKSKGNTLLKSLEHYKLLGTKSDNKFIPEDYKFNTVNIRLEVLQGLLDTDGYCSKNGTIQHYSVSKQLSDDVKQLVQSLGGVARQRSKVGSYKLPSGELKKCKICYTLTINLPEHIKPFKLSRKLENIVNVKKYHPSRGIKSIEFSRRTLGQCITVDAEDSLYVIDQYVVTHNTLMSTIASIESGAEKILIVCPANAKINWFREINAYIPEEDISIIKSGHWNPKKYTIINYDILKNFHTIIDGRKSYKDHEIVRYLDDEGFDLIILDESHMVKNPTSNRAKIINQISKKIKRRWLLTGTPLANRPMDFFNLLKICDSPVTASWKQYAFRYCDGKKFKKKLKNGSYRDIWITDGASNLEELHDRTKNLILRRKKDDHLDLPPKIVAPYYIEIDDMGEYNRVFEEYLEWAKSEGKRLGTGRHMVELIVLRKYLALEKTKQSIALAEQALENGKKVIIFTNFTHSFDALMKHFGKLAVGHNGKMNGTQKQNSVDQFQNNDNVMVFVGNLISAGTAITLTEAEVVIMNDLDFVPSNHAQAEDRAHRIGSQSTTNVYYPIVVGTIDEMMFKILEKKRKIIDTVIGDEHVSMTIEEDLFGEFMGGYF
jgi:superfamily II DNA or RNA helicase